MYSLRTKSYDTFQLHNAIDLCFIDTKAYYDKYYVHYIVTYMLVIKIDH